MELKTIIFIILMVILAVHYFLSIFTIWLLLKDKGITKNIIGWNIFILLVPLIGPCSYLITRTINKKKNTND